MHEVGSEQEHQRHDYILKQRDLRIVKQQRLMQQSRTVFAAADRTRGIITPIAMAFHRLKFVGQKEFIRMAEYHTTTWEGLCSLMTTCLSHVAPASGGTHPVPELASFLVPKGCMVKINAAIWHLCPLPANNEVLRNDHTSGMYLCK